MAYYAYSADFERAMKFLINHEGGTNDDPLDRGGLTNHGISQKQYPELDIETLTIADVYCLYWNDYWLHNSCDKLKPGLDIVVFDSSVNCGSKSAAQWLQLTLNKLGGNLKVDGNIGPLTIHESFLYPCSESINGIIAYRLKRYSNLIKKYKDQVKYIRGWIERAANLLFFIMND